MITMVLHRIIGALSSFPPGGIYTGLEKFVGGKAETYGQEYSLASCVSRLASCKLIFLGEIHSVPEIIDFQTSVVKSLTPNTVVTTNHEKQEVRQKQLHIVMEHFSFDMQSLLNDFIRQKLSFSEFKEKYRQIGSEGHDLESYQPLLEHMAANHDRIQLHAGFLSRTFARQLLEQGADATFKAAAPWLPPNMNVEMLEGSDFHYNLFESLISGREIHQDQTTEIIAPAPSTQFRKIFPAQVLKDVAMAEQIHRVLEQNCHDDDQVVVLAGNGHMAHYNGVPERVLRQHADLVDRTCVVTSHYSDSLLLDNSIGKLFAQANAGPKGANPADFLYLFAESSSLEEKKKDDDDGTVSKAETRSAYDQVGASAHHEGNLGRAHAILTYLGYTEQEIKVAGADAYNYQGVGNPHKHAQLQAGQDVLDVGSGLGVDSFIAAEKVGPNGKVVGIDLSAKQVAFAKDRVRGRSMENVAFQAADMEQMPFDDESFDVVISNGAFCLAPDKAKAFSEIYRVLRPGGRMVVCTTTIRSKNLQPGVDWPLCMRMFMPKEDLQPVCEAIGFEGVIVDDSDGTMTYELPVEEDIDDDNDDLNPARHRVHVGSDDFSHLENYNMDEICVRVCVVAKKPIAKTE